MTQASTSSVLVKDLTRVHLKPLDGLRGLAVLLVMCYYYGLLHPQSQTADAGPVLQVLHIGWLGVDLFFVLSGFLITGILLATRTQQHFFRTFLARRFLRIWPLYYANLVVFILIAPLVMNPMPAELQSMVDKQGWFWLYAANWLYAIEGGFSQTSGGYFWSLAVEEQFYLIWPFVIFALSAKSVVRVAAGLLVVSLVSRVALSALGINTNSLYTMTFTHLDGLAVGSILAICCRSESLGPRVAKAAPIVFIAALSALLVVWYADGDTFYWSHNTAVYGYTVIALLFGALLMLSIGAGEASLWRRTLQTRVLAAAGKFSYALYMIHVPIAATITAPLIRALGGLGLTGNVGFVCAILANLLLSFTLALLSWHLFEKRILALKSWFTYKETRVDTTRQAEVGG